MVFHTSRTKSVLGAINWLNTKQFGYLVIIIPKAEDWPTIFSRMSFSGRGKLSVSQNLSEFSDSELQAPIFWFKKNLILE